jgi:alkaline phosphatase D
VTGEDDLRRTLDHRLLLHRRRFLGLLAAGAGAAVLGACSTGDDDASGESDPSDTTSTTSTTVPPADGIDADPFTLGVASGDPLPTSVVLWTRLVTDPLDPSGNGGLEPADRAVAWQVAADDAFSEVVASGIEPAPAEFAHAVHVDVDGLEPDTWYWYRFQIGDFTSPAARTRTAPATDAEVDELRLAFASCQLRTAGHWTAYDQLVADEVDLVLFLGDYVYEYPGGEGELAVAIDGEPEDLAAYRQLYGIYKRDAKLRAAHASAPWVVTWDDHEVVNNVAGIIERSAAAYQAYWEHQPLRVAAPDEDGLQLYRDLRWGTLAEIFVLDGRQHRTEASMLGTEQEQWLTDGLTASTATWKVLAQQTVMKALVLGDLVLNTDQWDGYPEARRRLLESIRDEAVDNVVVLTGDIHAGGAADLRYPDAAQAGEVVAHEFVSTSISSPGLGGGALGAFDLSPFGLAYANFADHGYGRATVTADSWVTEFVVVDTIDAPTAQASVDATAAIEAGVPGIALR